MPRCCFCLPLFCVISLSHVGFAQSPGPSPSLHVFIEPHPDGFVQMAKDDNAIYFVQCSTANAARQTRERAESAGLLNRRIFVEEAPPWSILLADGIADMLTVDRWQGDLNEITRVLRPDGLASVAGQAIPKGRTPKANTWSHPYHSPDNNPLSLDPAVRAPYLTQFLAEPLFSSQPEVTVAAGGRIFKAFGHMAFRAYQNPQINTLFAMSAYNGITLWKRPLKPGFMIHRNTIIASPDTLYLADDESCKLIDAATGETRDQILAPADADGPVWKWMAIENGILYALLGTAEVKAPVTPGQGDVITGWPWAMWPGYDYADPKTAWGFGRTFIAFDLKTKAVLWQHKENLPVDSRGLCMKDGRIYFYIPDHTLACISAKDGSDIWRTSDRQLLDAIGPNEKAQHYMTGFSTSAYMKCTDKVLTFAGPQRRSLAVISAETGKLLWQRKGGNFQLVLRPEAIYALGEQGGKSFKFDYLTGRVLAEFRGRRACTRATGSIDSVFCRAIEGTIRWDIATDATQHIAAMRPACHDGVIISDGHLYWGPWICGCHLTLYGAICLTPAGDFDFNVKADESKQLQVLRHDTTPLAPFNIDPNDWPSYLANPKHTATTGARVADRVSLRWEYKPIAANIPTAPIAAGGLVMAAGDDGIVRAIDATTGVEKWKAYTASSIYFPPAISNGRAYVGSNDGRVYAFEAATGQPLWKFRAAPVERFIPVYGQLMSTWPVAGGVAVRDGVLYAAAGISHFDGTHVYALDATTGRLKWHNNSSGSLDPEVKNGVSVCGAMRVDGNRLSFPGGNVYATASYDIATGKCLNTPAGPQTVRRNVLFPRKVWDPMFEGGQVATSAGMLQIAPLRGRSHNVSLVTADPSKPLWTSRVFSYYGAAATANAALVFGKLSESEDGKPAPCRITALSLRDGSVLWSQPLPATPVHQGLAVDSAGRIIVCLEDGRVMCLQ